MLIDFTHRVFLLGTISYLLMDPKRGLFLTLDSGIMDLVRVHSVDGGWVVRDEALRPYYKTGFEQALSVYLKSPLRETATEKAKRALLGLEHGDTPEETPQRPAKRPSEGHGYTLRDLCGKLGTEPGKLRASFRKSGIQKPGSKWEWASEEEALLWIEKIQ